MSEREQEPFPVDETIKVMEGTTIYKTIKWWSAVLLVNTFGHDKVLIYLWQYRDGKWKRKQKLTVNFERNWIDTKNAVDKYLDKIKVS